MDCRLYHDSVLVDGMYALRYTYGCTRDDFRKACIPVSSGHGMVKFYNALYHEYHVYHLLYHVHVYHVFLPSPALQRQLITRG